MANPSEQADVPLEDLLLRQMLGLGAPPEVRQHIHKDARRRERTPAGISAHLGIPGFPLDPAKLWIVDRIMPPQTVVHFVEYLVEGKLPSGRQTELPVLVVGDVKLLSTPYEAWALGSVSGTQEPIVQQIMDSIGSMEDASRMQLVTKELHAMKSRVWEGIMPVSERRWRDKMLDDTADALQFTVACQLLSSVVTVFQYLNHPPVKEALRDTFNLIYDQLTFFDQPFNRKRESEGKTPVSLAAHWTEYMSDRYHVMVTRSHSWAIQKVHRLRSPVMESLLRHRPSADFEAGRYMGEQDDETWRLTNMVHELVEIAAHADFSIFMPMDGYKGTPETTAGNAPSQSGGQNNTDPTGMVPVSYSHDFDRRRREYGARLRLLTRAEIMKDFGLQSRHTRDGTPMDNTPLGATSTFLNARAQIRAQDQARAELRGESTMLEKEPWVRYHNKHARWGLVCYRVSQENESDAAWDEFRTKFEADVANWGEGLVGIEDIRARSQIHWVHAKDHGLTGDIEGLKRHFETIKEGPNALSKNINQDLFLVADQQSVLSYAKPSPESIPAGDAGGSILMVDCHYDPDEGLDRPDEAPGYEGTLRVLGSLLWDDVSPLAMFQSQWPEDLWGLAMNHPLGVYVGPVVKVQETAWRELLQAQSTLFEAFHSFRQQRGGV